MLRLSDLFPSPTNPRKTFPIEQLTELAESIKANGVINPITVRHTSAGYEVVSGGRRYRASVMAGLLEMPCIVRDLSDEQVLDIQIEENLHRQDVPPLEEAAAFHDLLTSKRLTVSELAGRLNKSAAYVYRRLKLNQLNEIYRPHIESGALPTAAAEVISSYTDDVQKAMYKKTFYQDGDRVTFLETRSLKDKFKWEACTDLKKAIWPLDRADLQPGLQSCNTCEKNTAVATLLFPDGADEPKCTDKVCWKVKESVWKALALKEWEAYCAGNGIAPKYADLHYYEMNDKKDVVKVLEYEPEVINRYNYEVVEEGAIDAFEVLFVGAEVWYQEERDKNYTRGWIRLTEKRNVNDGVDYQMREIDRMDISEDEKQALREQLTEKRRVIAEENARLRMEQKWKIAILENAYPKLKGGATDEKTMPHLLRLYVRINLEGWHMRSNWIEIFGASAKDWKPESFAIKVNGEGEEGKVNPAWTKGCEKAWVEVLEKKTRKGDHQSMDERAWADWISDVDKKAFIDGILMEASDATVAAIFAEIAIRAIAGKTEGYHREYVPLQYFHALGASLSLNLEQLKPDIDIDETDLDEDEEAYEDLEADLTDDDEEEE